MLLSQRDIRFVSGYDCMIEALLDLSFINGFTK